MPHRFRIAHGVCWRIVEPFRIPSCPTPATLFAPIWPIRLELAPPTWPVSAVLDAVAVVPPCPVTAVLTVSSDLPHPILFEAEFQRWTFLAAKQLLYLERYARMYLPDQALLGDHEFLRGVLDKQRGGLTARKPGPDGKEDDIAAEAAGR